MMDDWKKELEFDIPMQDEEQVQKYNEMLRDLYGDKCTPLRSTEDHVEEALNQIIDAFEAVCEAGGGYLGDGVKISVVIEYDPENK